MSENQRAQMGAKLGLSGVLEYRDKDGNLLKTVEISGAIPLSELGMSVDQARDLIQQQEQGNGPHNHD